MTCKGLLDYLVKKGILTTKRPVYETSFDCYYPTRLAYEKTVEDICKDIFEKTDNDEIIYFELNNWMPEESYPNIQPYKTWMKQGTLMDNDFCIPNKICVVNSFYDMSENYCVTATKTWVERVCPELLSKEYEKFIRVPDENGHVTAENLGYFLEYKPENFGVVKDLSYWRSR